MTATDLEWIVLKDFTPGIHNKLNRQGGLTGPFPLGAATEDETYRCIGLRTGGLAPLPRRTKSIARAALDTNGNVNDPVGQFYITGMYASGPILPASTTPVSNGGEMFFSFEYIYNNAGTAQRRYRLERYRGFDTSPTFTSLKSINSAETTPASAYRATTFGTTRVLRSAPTTPGYPVVVAAWFSGGGGTEKFVTQYPNDATPTTDAVFDISTTIPGEVMTHQGRVLIFKRTDYDHGVNGRWTTNEDIFYTATNNSGSVSTVAAVFVPEMPDGYGTWASMSANELFLVKFNGGGLTVNGDVADPTTVKLPNVVPTGAYGNIGCHSPVGFVYGVTEGGAWAWAGGDSCEYLSPQLEGNFWQVSEVVTKFIGINRGVWARWADWVMAPNNWVYDTQNKGWWRIENPSTYRFWNMQTLAGGDECFGAVVKFTDATTPLAHGFTKSLGAFSYSWKSHPLGKSMDRKMNVREMVLVVQGTGTVTVTMTGFGGVTRAETFTGIASDNFPLTIRKNTQLFASHVSVRIESDGGAGVAPVVYELRLGTDEKMRQALA